MPKSHEPGCERGGSALWSEKVTRWGEVLRRGLGKGTV